MIQSNKIKAELFNWGIAVDDNHDSGWKITKKSENLSTEDCKELRLKTKSGEISLSWMEKIKNGYGYFGRWKDQAVFAHYYVSPVESDRGSYFIPKDVMTIPFKSYIEKFECDNLMILESFPPPQNQISNRTDDEPEEIRESLYLQIKRRSLKEQLEKVKKWSLPGDILTKLLSSYLLPPHFCTILLWPESDAELLVSMLSLFPPSLRQFMTFCTCVSRPYQSETKIRVIEEPLGLDRLENYTLLDIRADSIKFRKENETRAEKPIARALIQLFTEKPEELEPFHDEIESMVKNRHIDTFDYNKIIYLVQEICISWNTHHMFNRLPGFNAKIKKLREFLDEDKTNRKGVIPFFIDSLKQAHHHEVISNLEMIKIFLNETKPLEPEEHNLFKDYLLHSFREINLSKDIPILNVFWSQEDLKKYIIKILFDDCTQFIGNPDWDTWEAFFYKFEDLNILLKFIKKDDIQEKLKQSEEGKIFLLIQDVIIWADGKQDVDYLEKSEKRILRMDDKSHLIRLFILCFRFLPQNFSNSENALGFLYLASVIYSLRWSEEKNRIGIFKKQFIELYSGLYFLRSIHEVDETIYQLNDRIVKKINQCDPTFGRKIENIIDVSKVLKSFRQVDQLMKDIIESFPFEKDGIEPFIQMFRSIHQMARNNSEKETFLLRILDYILVKEVTTPVKPFTAFLEYYEQENGGETNLKVLFNALKSNPIPLEDIDFFKRVLQVLLKQKDSNVRIQWVNLLLYLLKGVFIREALEEVNFFSVFRDIFKTNWKPESAEEVKSVYESVRYCFGVLRAVEFLEIGFSKIITEDERAFFGLSELYQKLKELGFIFKQKRRALGKHPERYQQLLDFLDSFENMNSIESLRFDKNKLDRKVEDIREEIDAFSNTLGSIETILKKLKSK